MARKKKRNILDDDDVPEMTAADFARARRMKDVMPEVVAAMKRGRGRPKLAAPKVRVSLRLDPKVVAAYKAMGTGWQTRINDILARDLGGHTPKKRRSNAA